MALAALSHRSSGAVFFAVFLSTLVALFAMFLCAVMPLKGPCVSPVSVWVVWDVCGAQKVQCGRPGSPFGPPSRLLRPYRGGEGGSEVLIGETTCGPGGPKLHRPSVWVGCKLTSGGSQLR